MKRSVAAARGALLASLVSLACQRPAGGELRDGCPGCTWQRLGLHPQAAAQPTATGRALFTLCPWRGRLYIGYGDYQANTGPIAVAAWDPARNDFVTVHTSDTEAIYNFRPIGGALYAPATDRRDHADYAVGEPWRDVQPVTVAHGYDMATLDGSDLWLVGSAEGPLYPPTAWRSTDGGAHWAIAHQRPENGRYYFAAVFGHRLYLESWSSAPRGSSEVFDGERWSAGPELLPAGGHGVRPVAFAGRLVYATRHSYVTPYAALNATPNRLLAFDGAAAAVAFDRELLDFFADDHALLVLDTGGAIWRTTDLVRWSRVAAATGFRPQSLALLDGALYVGTQDAELYRLIGWP